MTANPNSGDSSSRSPSPARGSVVVPSYNHAPFVEHCLWSIIKQTLQPAKLVVIDDGSRDASPRVIERVLKNCPLPSELIVRENRGLCATLNEGLARATGEYFAYLGSDDLWLPSFLQARIQLLEQRPEAVLAYGHAYFVDEENRIVDCTADWADYTDGDAREMLLRQAIAPMSPTVVYRRSVLASQAWRADAKLEDYDLYLRLSAVGDFAFDSRVLSAWRRHRANKSRDQQFMLDEQLKAQRAAAQECGMKEREIERLQTATRFRRAEDFLRVGDKATALKLMIENFAGMKSFGAPARMLGRLLTPVSVMRRRNEATARRAHQRFGSIAV